LDEVVPTGAPKSRLNFQENHLVRACKEEGSAFSVDETEAQKEWNFETLACTRGFWADGRHNPRTLKKIIINL
jgi:hypothetical protein